MSGDEPGPRARRSDEHAGGRGAGGNRSRSAPLRFYTIGDVAETLGLSIRSVRRQIASGQLAAHRFGGAVRIAEADLKVFLALHRHE